MLKLITDGIIRENPIMILMIGLCPVLACSATATDALGMGLAATFVLVCSNVMISAVRKLVPTEIRIPVFIVIIATFVTIVDYLMQAYSPSLSRSLGVFVPLIVVNCVILGRAEAFAYRNPVIPSFFDGVGMGLGFTAGILALGIFREALGNGTVFGFGHFFSRPAAIFMLPPGAYIGIGILISLWQYVKKTTAPPKLSPCRTCSLAKTCLAEFTGAEAATLAADTLFPSEELIKAKNGKKK
ncbi:MAG: electron transport complex subunit E [Endomicrobiia bacterium]|nr:electron transport complex subunit E [Endomicrobiia bacterium]